MLKRIIAAPIMLAALLLFTYPAFAEAPKGDEKCDKPWSKDCDKKEHEGKKGKEECDKKKGGYMGKRGDTEGRFDILKLADRLGLDEAQAGRIKKIRSEHEKEKIRLNAEIDILELELKELKHDYSVSIDSVSEKIRGIEAKRGDMEIANYRYRRDVKDVLTDKQQEQFKGIYMKMKGARE